MEFTVMNKDTAVAKITVTDDKKEAKIEKYIEDGYWYKVDDVGYEGLAEELISKLLSCSNIKNYVKYEVCRINGRDGCRSANFLEAGFGLTLNYSRLENLLAKEKESRALRVLRYQLARYRNVIPDAKLF